MQNPETRATLLMIDERNMFVDQILSSIATFIEHDFSSEHDDLYHNFYHVLNAHWLTFNHHD